MMANNARTSNGQVIIGGYLWACSAVSV